MSPQQITKKRYEMIQETEAFLNEELNHSQESGEFYPRMKPNAQTMDSWHNSFASQNKFYPHLHMKAEKVRIH